MLHTPYLDIMLQWVHTPYPDIMLQWVDVPSIIICATTFFLYFLSPRQQIGNLYLSKTKMGNLLQHNLTQLFKTVHKNQ